MTRSSRLFLVYWFPIVIYIAFIFVVSSFSHKVLPIKYHLISDKLLHFCEYCILAILMARAIASLPCFRNWWTIFFFSIFVVSALGLADELYQQLSPYRKTDMIDWLADTIGGITGSCIYLLGRRFFSAKLSVED
jgi:VanZ family protein